MKLLSFNRVPKYSIGIDFGTTTSRICFIPNERGITIPQSVHPIRSWVTPVPRDVKGKYNWYTGESVIGRFWDHYSKFKLKIGLMENLTLTPLKMGEEISFRPEVISASIIRSLWGHACQINSELVKYRNLTITVPAEWNAIQRQATIMSARIAGFTNVQLIEEPVAAYLAVTEYHDNDALRKARNILVFDYGGGTLDVTVIFRPERNKAPYIIGRSMIEGEIAGEVIDYELSKAVLGEDQWNKLAQIDRNYFANIVRQMKEGLNPKDLSNQPPSFFPWKDEILLPISQQIFTQGSLSLSYEQMYQVTKPLADKARHCIETAILKAQLDVIDIDAIIMVGGSSYLRTIQDEVRNFFPNKKDFSKGIYLENPEEVVAMGAALYQSFTDRHEKNRFQIRLPMETYLEYTDNQGHVKSLKLGDSKDCLPLKPRIPKYCPVPRNASSINWKVKQEHSYSFHEPDVVEQIVFEEYDGKGDQIRLDYSIDINGCISRWKPLLLLRQGKKLKTGSPRKYDLLDQEPLQIAKDNSLDFGLLD